MTGLGTFILSLAALYSGAFGGVIVTDPAENKHARFTGAMVLVVAIYTCFKLWTA